MWLRLHEKLEVLLYPDPEDLLNNKACEIMSRCPHEGKYLLSNYGSKDSLIAWQTLKIH